MNGRDIQFYLYVAEKAQQNGMKLIVQAEQIKLINSKTERSYGVFLELQEICGFLCGYEAGKSEGITEGMLKNG